jgi:hypothetical protein
MERPVHIYPDGARESVQEKAWSNQSRSPKNLGGQDEVHKPFCNNASIGVQTHIWERLDVRNEDRHATWMRELFKGSISQLHVDVKGLVLKWALGLRGRVLCRHTYTRCLKVAQVANIQMEYQPPFSLSFDIFTKHPYITSLNSFVI